MVWECQCLSTALCVESTKKKEVTREIIKSLHSMGSRCSCENNDDVIVIGPVAVPTKRPQSILSPPSNPPLVPHNDTDSVSDSFSAPPSRSTTRPRASRVVVVTEGTHLARQHNDRREQHESESSFLSADFSQQQLIPREQVSATPHAELVSPFRSEDDNSACCQTQHIPRTSCNGSPKSRSDLISTPNGAEASGASVWMEIQQQQRLHALKSDPTDVDGRAPIGFDEYLPLQLPYVRRTSLDTQKSLRSGGVCLSETHH